MAYFNTTHIRGQKLVEYEAITIDQEAMIAELFRRNREVELTPEDVFQHHPGFRQVPITSVRRAFTNLKDTGVIEKTDNQVDGMYGRPVYTWKLVTRQNPQPDLF